MSGDFISLRMLLVCAVPSEQELWRQGAALASVPIEFAAADAAGAGKTLAKGGVDICVIDSKLPSDDKEAALNAARAVEPAPFVVLAAPNALGRLQGSDGTLTKPTNPEDARKAVEMCVRVKVPTRVLIVDDSRTMRSIVRKILSASRFALDIFEAEEGTAALNELRGGNFGMVFLDYNMPGLNGFETLSEIKRESPNVAVVMMTAKMDDAMAGRARASGALSFLKKPFYPADIDAILTRFYGLSMQPG
jgi:DNA-binding response OmpR family regulator